MKKTDSETTKKKDKYEGFTEEERAAMKERARELKAASRANKGDGEADLLAKVAEMPESDRVIAERLHAIIRAAAPDLVPKTWYGMPAYATQAGKVVCFFQSADKFKARYATLGFMHEAHIDEGDMWPASFGILRITPEVEARVTALVKKAVS